MNEKQLSGNQGGSSVSSTGGGVKTHQSISTNTAISTGNDSTHIHNWNDMNNVSSHSQIEYIK